ncbi:hypothetical protein BDW42DRAFT_93643 [Aspergillus taichungensis]|uniref:Uncharacterized protein n=1 Tax=Aspergillus taichungensis TaxID=482145 RepID=A0A2J5I937_9EURO|nr:hypothetical protein BDW42DRAFT_93643 [Aspergillus taichungensis]
MQTETKDWRVGQPSQIRSQTPPKTPSSPSGMVITGPQRIDKKKKKVKQRQQDGIFRNPNGKEKRRKKKKKKQCEHSTANTPHSRGDVLLGF